MARAQHYFLGAGLGWLLGTGLQLQASTLQLRWAAAICLASLSMLLLLGWAAWRRRPLRWGDVCVVALSAGLAWSVTTWRADARLADRLNPALEGLDLRLTGTVRGLPRVDDDAIRFDFEPDVGVRSGPAGMTDVHRLPQRLRLGWYRAPGSSQYPMRVRAGEHWELNVRLKQVHGHANPAGFDYELMLFEQGIGATGSVRAARLLAPASGLTEGVSCLRDAVREAIAQQLGAGSAAGILAALSVGDQAAIERADWAVFRLTGVAHLVAISGMHVTLFAWLSALGIRAAWRRLGCAPLLWPAPAVARWGGVMAAVAYAVIAGWGVPAQRTVWMLFAAALVRSQARSWPWFMVLGVAGWVVIVLDPWALLQPGFWLSFVAVAVLMANGALEGLSKGPIRVESGSSSWPASSCRRALHWTLAALQTQLLITAALAPLSLLFFQQLSLVGLLANLVAIPVVTFLATPLALAGVFVPTLWTWGAWVLDLGLQGLRLMASWPWAAWQAPVAPAWCWVLALVGMGALALPWSRRLKGLGVLAMLPVFLHLPERPKPGEFELLAADVGQGNAVLLRTAAHDVLYDAGPHYGSGSDAGERVLVPLLQALGVRPLDVLVLSHRDSDHVGGAAAVLRTIGARRVQSSLESGHALRAQAPHQICEAGQTWQWDGVTFTFLHPERAVLDANVARDGPSNARSCVLQVRGRAGSVLLTGDIEALQELRLLASPDAASLRADVVMVPHHGSLTSSLPAFVSRVHSKWALVQAGYRNRFNHPAPSVVARYEAAGAAVVRTDVCGAWHWQSADGSTWCQRDRARRYWHAHIPVAGSSEAVSTPDSAWP